jgi:hypothetical protein
MATNYVRETKAGKSIGAYVVLRADGTEVATVQIHFADGGTVTVNIWHEGDNNPTREAREKAKEYGPSIGKARGYGYDKRTAALAGLEIDGHKLTDHCGAQLDRPESGFFPHDFKAPPGYSLANYTEQGYRSCYRESGLDYLKAIGYRVIQAI